MKKERLRKKVANKKTEGKLTRLQWTVRILILVIFVVALFIAAGRLMEWNYKQRLLDEARQEIEEKQGEVGGEGSEENAE